MPRMAAGRGQTRGMRTSSREHARAERLREHAAEVDRARRVAGVMGLLVRGREARSPGGAVPLEAEFAQLDIDGRALPGAVWVALRRDDVEAAVEAMTAASETRFLVEEREVIGTGYRLQSVEDTLPLPECELLISQVGRALGVPFDVLSVIAEWGADDPRAVSEIEGLLNCRFGPPDRAEPGLPPAAPADGVAAPADPAGSLRMTVAEMAEVLRLDADQARALAVLARNATVTVAGS